MIISLPLTVLNLLLFQFSNDAVVVQALFVPSLKTAGVSFLKSTGVSSSSKSSSSTTTLNARPNRDIDVSDRYSNLLKKIDVDAPTSTVSAAATTTTTTTTTTPEPISAPETISDSSPIQSIADKVNELVEQVNQAANVAIEASNGASDVGSSVSDVAATASAAAATAATALSSDSTSITDSITSLENKITAATSAATSASISAPLEPTAASINADADKVPSLFNYIRNVPMQTKENISLLKDNLINSPVNTVEKNVIYPTKSAIINESNVAKSVLDKSSQNINEMTQSAKSLVYGVGAATTAASGASADGIIDGTSGVDAATAAAINSINVKTFIDNLQFELYGSWYLAGATFLYALSAKESGRKEMREDYELELRSAQEKASLAAEAAGVAAEGAKMAKDLVAGMNIEGKSTVDTGELILENSRIQLLQVENDIMKEQMGRLEEENLEQKSIIAKLNFEINGESATAAFSTLDVIPVIEGQMERDPKEEAKFLKIIKDLDTLNAKTAKKAKSKVKAKKAKSKKTTKAKKKAKKVEVVAKAKEAKSVAKAKEAKSVAKAKKEKPVAKAKKAEAKSVAKAVKTKTVLKKKKASKKTKKEKALKKAEVKVDTTVKKEDVKEVVSAVKPKKVVPKDDFKENEAAAEEYLMDSISQIDEIRKIDAKNKKPDTNGVMNEIMDAIAGVELNGAAKDTAKSKTKKGPVNAKKVAASVGTQPSKKKPTNTKNAAASVGTQPATNPWGSLKLSTLQRKTIAQLTAYLEEREVNVKGLSKKDLVGTIQGL